MKDIPAIDLVRAELRQTQRTLAGSDAARLELRNTLNGVTEDTKILTEILAVLIHRAGDAGVTIDDTERKAAWDACWLRISVDFVEDDARGTAVRVSLSPPSADERKMNAAALVDRDKRVEDSGLKLIDP